jgi:3-hydroxyacyl-CoA dehydrogenase
MENNIDLRITLIGTGTIGLAFGALHLRHLQSPSQLTIYDPRPDLNSYIQSAFPLFLDNPSAASAIVSEINIASSLQEAVKGASIIQESGPENLDFKKDLWRQVEQYAPKDALLWSSTSGIPASQQSLDMEDKSRLIVVHPYNPPHIMPLLELVPSPSTDNLVISRTQEFWHARGRVPILLKKEVTGFVANRLAFALLRESIHLVNEGVVGVAELDQIVESSMGPRWAVAGPFKSYHAGGGAGGLEGLFKNIGGTIDAVWKDSGRELMGEPWERKVCEETEAAYSVVDTAERDRITKRVFEVIQEEKSRTAKLGATPRKS